MNPLLNDRRYIQLTEAASARTKVSGLTHCFYRYPARFGDKFVRDAILNFSQPGDSVLDPFCGGGTTLVEALATGRMAIGSDISPLALFVAKTKTTILNGRQLTRVGRWVDDVAAEVRPLLRHRFDEGDTRLSGLPQPYRNLLCNLRAALDELPAGPTRNFARCLLMKTGQWAFDGKENIPSPTEIVRRLALSFAEMQSGMMELSSMLDTSGIPSANAKPILIKSPADSLTEAKLGLTRQVDLVVTSPPYLGVHVLYNKWQYAGRKELRTPFFLADRDDLGGSSAYTIVSRHSKSDALYFERIQSSFAAIQKLLSSNAFVIQLVSFANPETALPRYLNALRAAGLILCETYVKTSGLQWRSVPARRWYARVGAVRDSGANQEVLLVHRKGSLS